VCLLFFVKERKASLILFEVEKTSTPHIERVTQVPPRRNSKKNGHYRKKKKRGFTPKEGTCQVRRRKTKRPPLYWTLEEGHQ